MLTGESAWLYRGGFLLFAFVTGLLIICVQNTECIVRRLLSVKRLVWLGQRSFSVYLVHYPLLLLMNPQPALPASPGGSRHYSLY